MEPTLKTQAKNSAWLAWASWDTTWALAERGIQFLGVGISGGEHGVRHGPSIMPGGPREAYQRVQPTFEASAAQMDNEPFVTWLGPRSAGHYVKMVHDGIEYGLMRLIAETYDLMKRGLGLTGDELSEVYDRADGVARLLRRLSSAWMPANLIQAQRDYFGAHTHERNDAKGTFHTQWEKA
jgi:6-phosphogluconate dehydrogenase